MFMGVFVVGEFGVDGFVVLDGIGTTGLEIAGELVEHIVTTEKLTDFVDGIEIENVDV